MAEFLDDQRIERYARHILLREVGGVGQEKLFRARVEIVGLGPSGSWAAHYLALAGVGTLSLSDPRPSPPTGLLPLIPAGARGSREQEAAQAIARFNPDVSCLTGGSVAPPEADETWIRILQDEGDRPPMSRLWIRTDGGISLVGWVEEDPPCPVCTGISGAPALPEASALAGSLGASRILGALLLPGEVPGLRRYEGGDETRLPGCTHR